MDSELCWGCGAVELEQPISGRRRRWCSDACRQRAYRERKTAGAPPLFADGSVQLAIEDPGFRNGETDVEPRRRRPSDRPHQQRKAAGFRRRRFTLRRWQPGDDVAAVAARCGIEPAEVNRAIWGRRSAVEWCIASGWDCRDTIARSLQLPRAFVDYAADRLDATRVAAHRERHGIA